MRIHSLHTLVKPQTLLAEYSLSSTANEVITTTRSLVNNILQGKDDRLLVIVGPCSIHDTHAALEYAELLKIAANRFTNDLCIVMRAYFEKPRTTMGWKGLINDPFLDNSFDMNSGLRIARKLLMDLNNLAVPTATEFLDAIIPQFLADLISWSAIGARTSASQLHRELASGLPMPVGFKNNTDGNIQIAIDAVNVAAQPHHFFSINQEGFPTILRTTGNNTCHIILRGADHQINYTASHISIAAKKLKKSNLPPHLIVDCSHGNSMKNYRRQEVVAQSIIKQIKNGSSIIRGIMLESHLKAGKQQLLMKKQPLIYGQSITDGCISWKETLPLLEQFALATQIRRNLAIKIK